MQEAISNNFRDSENIPEGNKELGERSEENANTTSWKVEVVDGSKPYCELCLKNAAGYYEIDTGNRDGQPWNFYMCEHHHNTVALTDVGKWNQI